MNLFNFKNKSNNGLSAATKKACLEFMQQESLNLPTLEEAVEVITGAFSPEQLKKLEIKGAKGDLISFEEQLLAEYCCYCPHSTKELILENTQYWITKYSEIFQLKETNVMNVFFIAQCRALFMPND